MPNHLVSFHKDEPGVIRPPKDTRFSKAEAGCIGWAHNLSSVADFFRKAVIEKKVALADTTLVCIQNCVRELEQQFTTVKVESGVPR